MKSINIILLTLLFTLISCNNEDVSHNENPSEEFMPGSLYALIKEYNVNKKGLKVEAFTQDRIDSTTLYFNGRINNSLWVGGYNKNNKKKIFEFEESEKLDTVFHVHIGYGVYKDYHLNFFKIFPFKKNDTLSFILKGYNGPYEWFSSDLYFAKENKLIKKVKKK